MATVSQDALDRARADVQDLYKQLTDAAAAGRAEFGGELQDATAQAKQLAAALHTAAGEHREVVRKHIISAATALDEALAEAKNAASASEADLRKTNRAMLQKARDAADHLSHAVAEKRAALRPPSAAPK
ncbi:MAG: hypothetical protein WCE44_04440 [Candidatus Velthaea sp.]|jgi:hypothetical protein